MNPTSGPTKGPSVQWNLKIDPTKVQLKSTPPKKAVNQVTEAKEAEKKSNFLGSEVLAKGASAKPVLKRLSQGSNDCEKQPVTPQSPVKLKSASQINQSAIPPKSLLKKQVKQGLPILPGLIMALFLSLKGLPMLKVLK